jgi:hypothetical protein
VIESAPAGRVVVANVATPPPNALVPRVVVPFLKVTEPVGVPVTAGVTVAVNVTDAPTVDGFKLDVTVVVVFCWTVCVRMADVLPVLFESPP